MRFWILLFFQAFASQVDDSEALNEALDFLNDCLGEDERNTADTTIDQSKKRKRFSTVNETQIIEECIRSCPDSGTVAQFNAYSAKLVELGLPPIKLSTFRGKATPIRQRLGIAKVLNRNFRQAFDTAMRQLVADRPHITSAEAREELIRLGFRDPPSKKVIMGWLRAIRV